MARRSVFFKLGVGAVVVPAAAFALGMLLQYCIPGCKCDEGAGCNSCYGLGGIIAFLTFGGFVGALASLIFVVPAAALLSLVTSLFDGKKSPRDSADETYALLLKPEAREKTKD